MRNRKSLTTIILDIVMVFVIAFAIIVPVSKTQPTAAMTAGQAETWRYYDEFSELFDETRNNQSVQVREPVVGAGTWLDDESRMQKIINDYAYPQNISDPTEETIELVEEAKSLIRRDLGEYTELYWEYFVSVDVKECDLPGGTGGVVAMYLPEENRVYIVRRAKGDKRQDLETIVHELIHCLTCGDEPNNMLREGATEYLAQQIVPLDEYSYNYAYPFAEAYEQVHGRKALIQAMLENTLMQKIDEDLGKPVMEYTNYAINCTMYSFSNVPKFAAIDVYCHYVAKYGLHVNETMKDTLSMVYCTKDKEARKYFMSVVSFGVLM